MPELTLPEALDKLSRNRSDLESEIQQLQEEVEEIRIAERRIRLLMGHDAPNGNGDTKTIVEYAVEVLEELGPPARDTKEVTREMIARGFTSSASNVYATVFGSLNRASKRDDPPIHNQDGSWALPGWEESGAQPEGPQQAEIDSGEESDKSTTKKGGDSS